MLTARIITQSSLDSKRDETSSEMKHNFQCDDTSLECFSLLESHFGTCCFQSKDRGSKYEDWARRMSEELENAESYELSIEEG